MSLKNTLAHGPGWHLYEEFGNTDGLYLRVDGVTISLHKTILKGMLPVLKNLEINNWELMGEEPQTQDEIDRQIEWLQNLSKNKQTEDWLPEDEDDS